MTGPPTPPPTTDTEIQDAARSASLQPQPAVDPPQAAEDPYTAIFPAIVELAAQSNFQGLIKTAEISDLNGDADTSRRPTRLLIVVPMVLSYLIIDDLPPARYALTRLHENLVLTPLGRSLLTLVASTMERKHANVYAQSENLFKLVQEPTFFDQNLAQVVANLVLTFLETFRTRTFNLLSKAYTSLPLPLAQTYLGLTTEQFLSAAEKNDWSYDPSTNTLFPAPVKPNAAVTVDPASVSTLSTFQLVANSVARFEL